MGEGLFQPLHLLVILGIALLLFGPSKLPQLGKGLGEAIRNFRDGLHASPDKNAINGSADKKTIDDGAEKK
jgi:sec-independent protein translocase protein TatA